MPNILLKDIAKKAKVSITAVSKVVNNLPMRISSEKRIKILELTKRLKYQPNTIAQALRNKRTRSIGIVVPDMSTFFYPKLIRSIETKLSLQGYQTFIANTEDNPSKERTLIEGLLNRLVDGLVITPVASKENLVFLRNIHKNGQLIILIDRYFPNEDFSYIVTDNKQAAKKGIQWLIKQGISQTIYIGTKMRHQSVNDRLSGVKEELSHANMRFGNENIFLIGKERQEIRKICNTIFENRKRHFGVFLESNRYLMGLLDAARDKGLFIPDDFSIIGFDPFVTEITYPEDFKSLQVLRKPTPIIKQPMTEIGCLISDYLISTFTNKLKHRYQIKVPAKIIISQSTIKENE